MLAEIFIIFDVLENIKKNMNNTEKPQIHCHSIAKGRVISFVKVKLTRLPSVYNITHMNYKSLLEKI